MEKIELNGDFKGKYYFENNEIIQFKYFSSVYAIIHGIFIMTTSILLIFIEIMISMQSTFLTQIVDATCSTGITLGVFYLLISILELILGMKFF